MHSFAVLEPTADGFRNYFRKKDKKDRRLSCLSIGRDLLTLTAPEMTVLIGGLRVECETSDNPSTAFSLKVPEAWTNDFFVNLLDMNTKWQKSATSEGVLEGRDRATGQLWVTGTRGRPRLRFELPALVSAEFYACGDSQQEFVRDFVAAWSKVMNP